MRFYINVYLVNTETCIQIISNCKLECLVQCCDDCDKIRLTYEKYIDNWIIGYKLYSFRIIYKDVYLGTWQFKSGSKSQEIHMSVHMRIFLGVFCDNDQESSFDSRPYRK